MASAAAQRVPDETITRVTKEGRKLTYCLTVIQQPERARACGSGAKSSADRRPVDPPPVVELRILEGEDQKNDVTFSYNANFFLFTTLEVARPMAHGRGQPAAPQIPVLTGMPVSGMAYLDRPTEAGYFIFPDLSVRHEGKYRLSFNLYEETKEAKDADAEPAPETNKITMSPGGNTPSASFDWRMEVKSAPFTVFSAKKFPGLAESTVLSRTVAEQGCRVRIRRDVRMRRRDGKGSGDYDGAVDDEYARSRRTATPNVHDPYPRERSLSQHSEDRPAFPEPPRRPSSGEYPPQSYNYTPSPVTPQQQSTPQSYLTFGSAAPYPAPQYAQPPPPPPPPPSTAFAPPPNNYHPASAYRQPPPPPAGYPYDRAYPPQQQQQQPPAPQQPQPPAYAPRDPREAYDAEYRKAPSGYIPPQNTPYPAVDPSFARAAPPPYVSYPPRAHTPTMPGSVNLAPLKMPPPMEPKLESLNSPQGPLPAASRPGPPLPSPSYERERGNSSGQYSTPPEASRNGKRTFDSVFTSAASSQPLFNGQRPSSSHRTDGSMWDDDDESISLEQLKMSYKRADGSSYSRELPVLE